jgi:acyl-coenzyme A synthetase/AMP-(fatty) acid ligase
MAEKPGLTPADALVAVTTVSFDISGLELWLPLITGARVVIATRDVATDGNALRELLERTAAAHASGRVLLQATPATWRLLIEAGWSGTKNLVMLCGGEGWPAGLATQLLSRGAELWNVYGPTETTIWSTRERVTSADVSLGEPLANTTLFVLEPSGEVAPLGVAGELWIGGAGLAVGYHGRPDLTEERFVDHPELGGRLYRTGDLVRRTAEGRLTYLGRLDDQVKVRGYRIELGEIESVIAGTPEVVQVVASVQRAGETARLVCHVVLTEAGKAAEEMILAGLMDRLRRALPDYMVPSAIMRLDALPLTPNGKVDRRALPVPDASAATSARPYVAPRSSLEREIAEVWRDVLGVERVGVHDDFFALGGHSLLAMRALARLGDIMPVRLTLASLFEARTVAALASYAVQALATTTDASDEDDLERMLAELEALSDDEAARLQNAPGVEGAR